MSDTQVPVIHVGVVARFNTKGGFGFIRSPDFGGELFFHFNGGERAMMNERGEPMCCADLRPERDPEPGTHIYFRTTPGRGGDPKAEPWCFADDYDRLVRHAARKNAV